MPDTTHRLVGADENPADDLILVDDATETAAPAPAEDDGGLIPAPGTDGRTAARHLQRWLADHYNVHRDPMYVWGAVRRTPGAFTAAKAKGYGQFVCRTHGMIHCRECACPVCGAPGGCSCGAREVKGYREHPPLPRKIAGIRRTSIEAEMMFSDRTALQHGLGEYPWGHDDASLHENGWLLGAEFKINGYASDASRKIRCDIIDRIGKVGGVGAPKCTGLHVHIEAADHDDPTDLRRRWEAIEEDLFRIFPSRLESPARIYCVPLGGHGVGALREHHSALSGVTRHGTWEVRIHPGSTSWVAVACWTDWCLAFIEGRRTSPTGEAYLNARRAQLAVNPSKGFPWVWRRAIERWHQRNGQSYHRTLGAIAAGTFRRFETADGLRAALRTAA